jgi:hypothetical protein
MDPRKGVKMIKRFIPGATLAAAMTLTCATAAFAASGGAGTETITEHGHGNPFFSAPVTDPCNGAPGIFATISTNEVFHLTTQADGNFWVTGTAEGTATFTPEEAGGVSASGHFTAWFGEAGNQKNHVEHNTFNAHLTGTDGSHISVHGNAHTSTNAHGVVTVSFENMRTTCTG